MNRYRHRQWRPTPCALLSLWLWPLLCLSAPLTLAEDPSCRVAELSEDAFRDYDFNTPPPGISVEEGELVTVTEIRVHQQKVFQEETPWFKRLANRYHWQTRDKALEESLPFAIGDQVSAQQLAEAERILRAKPYLFEAAVVVSRSCRVGERTDVRLDAVSYTHLTLPTILLV